MDSHNELYNLRETIKVAGSVALVSYIWSPLLNDVSIVNVPSPSALHVCSDGVKDIAADATTNKVANHANVTTNIATVKEDILHKYGNKAVDSDVIANMSEGTIDEAIG